MFTIDTHVHTDESSSCGKIPGAEVARLYAEAGYDAIVITDHYYDALFERMGDIPWPDKVRRYLAGYRAAAEAGERLGLRVILGLELRLVGAPNDFLVFGPDEQFLLDRPALYELSLSEVRDMLDDMGGVTIAAHPFRGSPEPTDPATIHGVEVMNGHPRQENRNALAQDLAERYGLIMVGGSDAHFLEGVARVRMLMQREITDGLDLAAALRSGEAAAILGPDEYRLPLEAVPFAAG